MLITFKAKTKYKIKVAVHFMIIKKYRTKPFELLQHEHLLKRLPENHYQYNKIENQMRVLTSGYIGEKSLDYFITLIPHNDLFVFQDLRLPNIGGTTFQIDFLLFTPYFFIILDSKYLKGKLNLSEFQLVQEYEDRVKVYQNPIDQVHNQLYNFKQLLQRYSFIIPPSHPFVVFTHPNSILELTSDHTNLKKYILRPEKIRTIINEYFERMNENYYTIEEMNELSQLLIRLHTPKTTNILEYYKINYEEIRKGVFCPDCGGKVIKEYGWICTRCNNDNQQIYLETMLDYYYLYGEQITMRACVDFFQLNSRHIAYYLLKTQSFIQVIDNRKGVYQIDIRKLKKKIYKNQ